MIQSVTFGDILELVGLELKLRGKNTWDDWKIVPVERPVFKPPEPKTSYINIPGGNGALDLSEALTGYPVYNNRVGSFTFRVMNDFVPWNVRYSEIMEFLHGRTMKIILEDEPEWFYHGRVTVDGWSSGDTWSLVTITSNVGPYKWFVESSLDDWLWNPFSFETGIIQEGIFENIVINSLSAWVSKTFDSVYFGSAPISPSFMVSNLALLEVQFVNNFLGINKTVQLVNGRNDVPDFIFYGADSYTLSFKGFGTVSIEFRRGKL